MRKIPRLANCWKLVTRAAGVLLAAAVGVAPATAASAATPHTDPVGTDWERMQPDGTVNGGGTSWAHGWSTGATSALSQYVLGVSPAGAGYKTWLVQPHPAPSRSGSRSPGTRRPTRANTAGWPSSIPDRWRYRRGPARPQHAAAVRGRAPTWSPCRSRRQDLGPPGPLGHTG
jgi:hypothetical protein